MKAGDRVKIIDAAPEYPWKKELIGACGSVDEISNNGKAIAVRLDTERIGMFPVWFAAACVEVVGKGARA